MRRAARVDENQKEIVKAFRDAGAVVLHIYQLKNCFDILVFHNGAIYPIEIKVKKGKKTADLTDGETTFKQKIEAVGCKYYIIDSVENAINLLK